MLQYRINHTDVLDKPEKTMSVTVAFTRTEKNTNRTKSNQLEGR